MISQTQFLNSLAEMLNRLYVCNKTIICEDKVEEVQIAEDTIKLKLVDTDGQVCWYQLKIAPIV